jgi:hypothetical protein
VQGESGGDQPKSGFGLFCQVIIFLLNFVSFLTPLDKQNNRKRVKELNPNADSKEVKDVIQGMWDALPQEKRDRFEEKAKQLATQAVSTGSSGSSGAAAKGASEDDGDRDGRNHDYCDKCGLVGDLVAAPFSVILSEAYAKVKLLKCLFSRLLVDIRSKWMRSGP